MLSAKVANSTITKLTGENRVNVLIIDDTMFERNSSKKVELLTKVYDHAKKKYIKGFRLLTLGWSDGNTFLPVNSCLLSSENEKSRINESKKLDKRSVGFSRRKSSCTKVTTVMLELIDSAIKACITATHVLFDTWFCSPSSLIVIKKKNLDVIATHKITPKMHYLYKDEMQSLANILALISTDMTIDEDEIIRIYGKRWNIEVFFKVCKSYLKLSKECNSLSYDAMTAHTAVVFTRYMLLAVENRQEIDDRTIGEIFYYLSDELADITWIESFYMLMQLFLNTLSDNFELISVQLDKLMNSFITSIPKELKLSFHLCA